MKWLLVLLVIVGGFFGYRMHLKQVEEAATKAALETEARMSDEKARKQALREERLKAEKERAAKAEADRKKWEEEHRRAMLPAMGIAQILDPLVIEVLGPLRTEDPGDFVPVLQVAKQRVLALKPQAEAGRKPAFDLASDAFDALIALAEERTKSLEAALENKQRGSSLDAPSAGNSTSEFFVQSLMRRWEETATRYRPLVAQRVEALRAAEQKWNATLPSTARPEAYQLPLMQPAIIEVGSNSKSGLDVTHSRTTTGRRPWRVRYYDQYGYSY